MLKPYYSILIPKILIHYALQFTYYASHFGTEILWATVENMDNLKHELQDTKDRNFNVIMLRNLNFCSYTTCNLDLLT